MSFFGIHKQEFCRLNYILLFAKYFIWKAKFGPKKLDINLFKAFILHKIQDIKDALEYCDKSELFHEWNDIFVSLKGLPCLARTVATMPAQTAGDIEDNGAPIP